MVTGKRLTMHKDHIDYKTTNSQQIKEQLNSISNQQISTLSNVYSQVWILLPWQYVQQFLWTLSINCEIKVVMLQSSNTLSHGT